MSTLKMDHDTKWRAIVALISEISGHTYQFQCDFMSMIFLYISSDEVFSYSGPLMVIEQSKVSAYIPGHHYGIRRYNTVYGCNRIKLHPITLFDGRRAYVHYQWRIKFETITINAAIGISSKLNKERRLFRSGNYGNNEYYYALDDDGELNNKQGTRTINQLSYGDDDYVYMRLNSRRKTLSFSVNSNNNFVVAFRNLNVTKTYRLCISLLGAQSWVVIDRYEEYFDWI